MAGSKKFFVDINLQGNGLNNSTVGANADMTKAGSFQYDSVANRLQYYNGATIETIANLNDLTGGLDFQGAYDALTNDPNLTSPAPGAIFKGYYYVVTVAGDFFGQALAVGDSLFANVNDPNSLADWTLVQGNVVIATTEVAGITYLASAAQVADGTETGAYAVNPATLQGKIKSQSYYTDIATGDWELQLDGSYKFNVLHELNLSGLTIATAILVNTFYNNSSADFSYHCNDIDNFDIFSNFLPAETVSVSVSISQGNA